MKKLCDCSRPAVVKRQGEHICARCLQMEADSRKTRAKTNGNNLARGMDYTAELHMTYGWQI